MSDQSVIIVMMTDKRGTHVSGVFGDVERAERMKEHREWQGYKAWVEKWAVQ